MGSKYIEEDIIEAGVLHLPINFSDQCTIFCHLSVSELKRLSVEPNNSGHKPAWENASDENMQKFHKTLEHCLKKVKVEECLIKCQDVHYNELSHTQANDDFIINIYGTSTKKKPRRLHCEISTTQ